MSRIAAVVAPVLLVAIFASVAVAGQSTWYFQDTKIAAPSTGGVSLAMRNGFAWPVIFSSNYTTAMLPTGWYQAGMNLIGPEPRAASSVTGEVAAWNPGTGVVSGPTGWQILTDPMSLAFDSKGRLWQATSTGISYRDGGTWHTLPTLPVTGYSSIAIAVSGNDTVGYDVHAITYGGSQPPSYLALSALTGPNWTRSNIMTDPNGGGPPITELHSLALDSHGIPHITAIVNGQGAVLDFNPKLGAPTNWTLNYLPWATGLSSMTILPLAVSGDGTVGTAYVGSMGGPPSAIYLAQYDGGAGWTTTVLPTSTFGLRPETVGLAYDYNDLPVIAFAGATNMILAYDPIEVPEPVSLAALCLGGLALLRRRK